MQNQETVPTITDAVKAIIRIAGIEDKTGLDNWCGGTRRTRMYDEVRRLAPRITTVWRTPMHPCGLVTRLCYLATKYIGIRGN